MRDSGGTTHVVFTDHEGWPAFYDKEDPDNLVAFQGEEEDDEGSLH
jgi:hypothetical protein